MFYPNGIVHLDIVPGGYAVVGKKETTVTKYLAMCAEVILTHTYIYIYLATSDRQQKSL